jgi:hypothetical protein
MSLPALMLYDTFVHLSGIGAIKERELWKRGILDWDQFLGANSDGLLRERPYRNAVHTVRQSLDALNEHDIGFLAVQPHAVCSAWNYTITPRIRHSRVIPGERRGPPE